MKKLLIGTSALVAAAGFAGAAQAADPIKLSVGGYGSTIIGYASQDDSFLEAAGQGEVNAVDVKGDSEIHFKGKTTLDNGLTVSVKYEFEAGGRSTNDVPDEWNISLSGAFGTIVTGADDNALVAIAKGGPRVGGRLFNGALDEGDLLGGNYVIRPDGHSAPTATFINTNGDSESISYISPAFAGFTFGATYVPDLASTGGDSQTWPGTTSGRNSDDAQDAYGVGLMYNGEFGGVGVGVEGGWLTADRSGNVDDHNEYQVGAQVSVAGFAFGAAYRQINIDLDTGGDTDSFAWEVGASYETGPYGVSLNYFAAEAENDGNVDEDETQVIELATQYNMGPGVDLVGGIAYVEFDDGNNNTAAGENDGFVVATGLSLAF